VIFFSKHKDAAEDRYNVRYNESIVSLTTEPSHYSPKLDVGSERSLPFLLGNRGAIGSLKGSKTSP